MDVYGFHMVANRYRALSLKGFVHIKCSHRLTERCFRGYVAPSRFLIALLAHLHTPVGERSIGRVREIAKVV